MAEKLTQEEINHIKECISNQEGQNYPCSNQVVLCGFIGSVEQWNNFVEENYDKILRLHRVSKHEQEFELMNHERWRLFNTKRSKVSWNNCRGYRFYKLKVTSNIDRKIFKENIYPYCSGYCCEIEFI